MRNFDVLWEFLQTYKVTKSACRKLVENNITIYDLPSISENDLKQLFPIKEIADRISVRFAINRINNKQIKVELWLTKHKKYFSLRPHTFQQNGIS